MVETAGIEPASENSSASVSPGAVGRFTFPLRCADRQAQRFSSFWCMTAAETLRRSRSLLIDARIFAAVLKARTGCVKQPSKL